MFKIQNFFNRTRLLLNKIKSPKNKSKVQSSFRTSVSNFSNFIPSTCFFSMNLLSMDRLKFKTNSSLESDVETPVFKVDKKDVKELIALIATEIREENLQDARTYIDKGIQIAEENNFTEYLPSLYDLLVTITLKEGNNALAEEILVRSIEKLTELGYKEADNEIVRFQLVLARLYQSKGDSEMAGLGFRNCLSVQETKFNADKDMDVATLSLYLSLLFWYSIFLSDENELIESKNCMKKALQLSKLTSKQSAQTLVVLHYLAELSFRLKVNFLDFYSKHRIRNKLHSNRNSTMLSNISLKGYAYVCRIYHLIVRCQYLWSNLVSYIWSKG